MTRKPPSCTKPENELRRHHRSPEPLTPETDSLALRYGIGFTDVVKRPTRGMAELKPAEFAVGATILHEKLMRYQPLVICFNGLTGYKNYMRNTGRPFAAAKIGVQADLIGHARVFVLPSSSPANAAVSLERIVEGMRELKALASSLQGGGDAPRP